MGKVFILLLLVVVYVLYTSADKLNMKKKNLKPSDESFTKDNGHKYPTDFVESVHSNIPGDPQIKIHFAGMEDDATISADTERSDEEDDDDDDDVPIKKRSKTEDIHSFL